MAGWWLYISYVSIVLLNATAFPVWLRILAPQLVEWGYLYTVGRYKVYLGYIIASLLILTVFFLVNYFGVKTMGRVKSAMSLTLVVGGLLYIVLCLSRGDIANTWNPSPWSIENGAVGGIITWLAIAPWAYVGFDTVPQAIEEAKVDPRKAFLAIFIALLAGASFYAFVTLATAAVRPWSYFLGTWLATATAAGEATGDVGVAIVLISALMGILTSANGFMYASSRLLFAMSRDELLPKTFSDLHENFGTPHKALLLAFILSLVGPLFGREALLWFVDIASFGTALAYLYVGLTIYKQRRNLALKNNKRENQIKTVAIISSITALIFLLLLMRKLWISYRYTPFLAIALYTLVGILLYRFRDVFR